MFLDNINETQNRYYFKASCRRKQNDTDIIISAVNQIELKKETVKLRTKLSKNKNQIRK